MDYTENMYRIKKIENRFLLTTDHGSWISLDEKQLRLLRSGKIEDDPKLFRLLKKKGVIVTDDNKEEIIEKLRNKYSFLFQGTSLHIVIPTLRCNEKCIYCHASSRPKEAKEFDMDKETAKTTVDFIFQSPSPYIIIEFQGGEPLLNFGIIKYIIEYAKELNKTHKKDLLFSLVSNLSLMDNEKMEYLIKNKVGICTSLDGPEWLHNKNRPFRSCCGNTSYYYTKKWIKKINNEYKKRKDPRSVHALITITSYSLDYWKDIIDEYIKLGLGVVFLRFLNNLGDARRAWKNISYPPEEFIKFWKKSMDYILELNKKGKLVREWLTCLMLRKILKNIEPNFFEQRSPCGAVIGQITYNYNGDIYTCDEGRMVGEDIFMLGNVKKDKYKDIASSDQACGIIASSINDTQICDSCVFKPYCGICPVCNYAEQGSIIGKISESNRCKIYKTQFDYIFDKIMNDKGAKRIFMKWLKK